MPYDPSGIPVGVDEEDTRPVAIEEMERSARRSRDVPDLVERPLRIVTGAERPPEAATAPPTAPPTAVSAELSIAGVGALATLPIHALTSTGVSLAIPPGIELALKEDVLVVVGVEVARAPRESLTARITARVAHHRAPREGGSGGLSLRWDTSEPGSQRELDALLAVLSPAP